MTKKKLIFGALFLVVGVIAGLTLSAKLNVFTLAQSQSLKQDAVVPTSLNISLEDAVVSVANTAGKAVVSISTEHTTKVPAGGRKFYFNQPFGGGNAQPFNDEFRKYFDDFFGQMPDQEFKQMGLGSGVIIDNKGYILTNEHVVNNADKITVTLPDGRELKGEIKGKDARSDLALITVNAPNLPSAALGDSDTLKIGQWVVAIGNPFGFAMSNPEPTVTAGVISALHRTLGRVVAQNKDFNDLIQTDAAINPGNSGGPLVNLKGEIIGVNVAIFSTSGGYQGVGFAIPINNAKRIITRLIEGKKIAYGWLGVTVQDLSEDMAKYFGLSDKKGVLIAKVIEDGPGAKSDMKERDIIKMFDNKPINQVKDLLSIVGNTEVGRKVKVVVLRDKKEVTLDVQVGERPEAAGEETGAGGGEVSAGKWRGISAEDIGPATVQRFKVKETAGVVVTNVEPNTPADEAGIIPGDVILEMNKQPVKNMSEYQKLTQGAKGDVLVRTARGYFLVKEKAGE